MPLYEYQCDSCGHRFERIQRFSDAPIETCPKCGKSVRKLLSSPAFQFKGSGWYVTDYARKTDSSSKKNDGDSRSGSKDASSTDSKTSSSEPASSSTESSTSSSKPDTSKSTS